jgi:hypothetical protein
MQLHTLEDLEKQWRLKFHTENKINFLNITPSLTRNTANKLNKEATPALQKLLLHISHEGLKINSLDIGAEQYDHTQFLKLNMQGTLVQWLHFIFSLNTNALPLAITHLSCHTLEHNELSFTLDIRLLNTTFAFIEKNPVMLEKLNLPNPFCNAKTFTRIFNAKAKTLGLHDSLFLMKMRGSLQQEAHQAALILLPNQQLISVPLGARLGQERAILKEIRSDHLLLLLPNKKEWHMPMY